MNCCNLSNQENNNTPRIRVGKPFKLKWELKVNNRSVTTDDLEHLSVTLIDAYRNRINVALEDIVLKDGGVVEISINSVTLPRLGFYDLEIRYDETQGILDVPKAFKIVDTTANENITDLDAYNIQVLIKGDKGEKGEDFNSLELLETLQNQQQEELNTIKQGLQEEQTSKLQELTQNNQTNLNTAKQEILTTLSEQQTAKLNNTEERLSREQNTYLGNMHNLFSVDEQNRLVINNRVVSNSLKGADGLTPYIKEGTWWIGDKNTEVHAEVNTNIFTTDEWLRMAHISRYKVPVADEMIEQGDMDTLDKLFAMKDTSPKLQRNQTIGGRTIPNQYTYEWYIINDITKYGNNLIINVSLSYSGGHAVLYWKQYNQWKSAVAEPIEPNSREKRITVHINNPQGEVVLMCRPIWEHGYQIKRMDVYSPNTENIVYPVGTWLGRNKLPYKGESFLCTNIGVNGEKLLLTYDGHYWVTPWGARIEGETTAEARDSYKQAILRLRNAIINPIE